MSGTNRRQENSYRRIATSVMLTRMIINTRKVKGYKRENSAKLTETRKVPCRPGEGKVIPCYQEQAERKAVSREDSCVQIVN